jgi:dipeptidase D
VIAWSKDIPDFVETSTNLASIKSSANNMIEIVSSQRSSIEQAKHEISSQIKALFLSAGAEVIHSNAYPGWKPNSKSEILQIASETYLKIFGELPKAKAIHAGLECGLFLEKYPDLDMISFGPTIKGAHSPDERIHIESTNKFWKLLLGILQNIPMK